LAQNEAQLAQHRARLIANRDTCPLFDTAGYTRALERLLFAAWEERVAPPRVG
jgi:predicted O-linked N-acetylglucosamine transferase (SPINDLY family)